MKNKKVYSQGVEFQQITITAAKKLWNEKKKVYVIPCNMRIPNPWQSLVELPIYDDKDFDSFVNEYKYYNCDKVRGKYLHFYKASA